MAESTPATKRSDDTPPPRPEPNPLLTMRPEISKPVIGSPQEWLRRIKRKFAGRDS